MDVFAHFSLITNETNKLEKKIVHTKKKIAKLSN